MNLENLIFVVLTCVIAFIFTGHYYEQLALIIAGALIGKFLALNYNLPIYLLVLAVYVHKANESDTSMRDIYQFLAFCFSVALIFGNVYYYSFHYLVAHFPAIKGYITTPLFTINLLR